ncbi:MAG TPA: hypothetical protein VGM87_09890 [Roseomonas sp.]|jgi:hypothetical protein
MMTRSTPLILAMAMLGCMFGGAMAQAPMLMPAGPPETLYRWTSDRCEDEFIPDAPARAFRRADGAMVLMASHRENWALTGRDFATLRPSCEATLRSSRERPQDDGFLWIEATFTSDGRRVAALVSEDLRRPTLRGGCDPQGQAGRCWLNNILAAASEDGGRSFALLRSEARTVATLGRYPERASRRYGAFTTSNILQHDGAYYVMVYLQGEGVQPPGNCLFRSDDPFAPERWRAWDGQGFTVEMRDASTPRACRPVSPSVLSQEVRSLTFDSRHGRWIAVIRHRLRLPGDAQPVPGFYYATSPDLLRWEGPRRIMAAPTRARTDSRTETMDYPALIDPGSRSRNFDTLDSTAPVLVFTVQNLAPGTGTGTMNRDLRFVRLRVE